MEEKKEFVTNFREHAAKAFWWAQDGLKRGAKAAKEVALTARDRLKEAYDNRRGAREEKEE